MVAVIISQPVREKMQGIDAKKLQDRHGAAERHARGKGIYVDALRFGQKGNAQKDKHV